MLLLSHTPQSNALVRLMVQLSDTDYSECYYELLRCTKKCVITSPSIIVSAQDRSTYAIDCNQLLYTHHGQELIAKALPWGFRRDLMSHSALAGVESSLPLLFALQKSTKLPIITINTCSNNKSAAAAHTPIDLDPESSVIVVDTVVIAGSVLMKLINYLRARGFKVVNAISLVDCTNSYSRTITAFRSMNVIYKAVFTIKDLL